MPDQTQPPLGDLDGEAIDAVTIRFSGAGRFPRRLEDGERVLLVIAGTARSDISIKRKDGELIRGQTITIESVAEPTDQLASEAEDFLQAIADEIEGRIPLSFDEEDVADAGDDDGSEPPGSEETET